MAQSMTPLLHRCLPLEPAERQHCSGRISASTNALTEGSVRLQHAVACCARAMATPEAVGLIRNYVNRDNSDMAAWATALQNMSAGVEHPRCGTPPSCASDLPAVSVLAWNALGTNLDSGNLDLQRHQITATVSVALTPLGVLPSRAGN